MIRAYKKHIAEGKHSAYIALFLFIVLRIGFFVGTDAPAQLSEGGCLWMLVSPLFENAYVSALSSALLVIGIAFLVTRINSEYALIRTRTSLPFVFILLLFSSHPQLIWMNPQYVAVFFLLLGMEVLLKSYQQITPQKYVFQFGFILAVGSLFSPELLLCFPLFLIGFSMMRSLNFKGIIAFLLAIIMVYSFTYSCFFLTNTFDESFMPFTDWQFSELPVLSMSYLQLVLVGFVFITLITIFVNNYMSNFKDKIRIRASISFLNILVMGSFLSYLFVPINYILSLFIFLVTVSFILSHFFALAHSKWKIYFFYLLILIYLVVYFTQLSL